MTVKNLVDLYRMSQSVSYNDLAKQLGTTKMALYKMINQNDGMNISLSNFLKIANALGLQLVMEGVVGGYEDPILDGEDDSYLYDLE